MDAAKWTRVLIEGKKPKFFIGGRRKDENLLRHTHVLCLQANRNPTQEDTHYMVGSTWHNRTNERSWVLRKLVPEWEEITINKKENR